MWGNCSGSSRSVLAPRLVSQGGLWESLKCRVETTGKGRSFSLGESACFRRLGKEVKQHPSFIRPHSYDWEGSVNSLFLFPGPAIPTKIFPSFPNWSCNTHRRHPTEGGSCLLIFDHLNKVTGHMTTSWPRG